MSQIQFQIKIILMYIIFFLNDNQIVQLSLIKPIPYYYTLRHNKIQIYVYYKQQNKL